MAHSKSPQKVSSRYPAQRLNYFNDTLLIHCVDFPIYYADTISDRYAIVAGGGGSSNTGVYNQINILEIFPTKGACTTELVTKYRTPKEIPTAIMTGALIKDNDTRDARFVTVDERNLVIYNLDYDLEIRGFLIDHYIIQSSSKADINCIRYSRDEQLYTGSLDGQLALWDLKKDHKDGKVTLSVKGHEKAIDEIDINPLTQQIVTLSRDENKFILWTLNDCKLIKKFGKEFITNESQSQNQIANVTYRYRSCIFAHDKTSSNPNESFLLVACNPSKGSSLVYKLSTNDNEVRKIGCKAVANHGISAVNISEDGKYFGVGSRSGSVSLFDSRTLKIIYKFDDAHQNAVTRLVFLPAKKESLILTNSTLCPFLSTSIDRRVILHKPGRSSFVKKSFNFILMVILLFIAFIFIQSLYQHGSPFSNQNRTSPAIENQVTERTSDMEPVDRTILNNQDKH